MKKSITKALAVFMSLMLVLMSALPAMAENSSEVEAYLNSTYAKAIDPYGNPKKDDEGRYKCHQHKHLPYPRGLPSSCVSR